jgi:hypothetical protein
MPTRSRRAAVPELTPLQVAGADVSLLDLIDHVLNQGVVLSAELTLGVADVDLIYLRLLATICSADRAESLRSKS